MTMEQTTTSTSSSPVVTMDRHGNEEKDMPPLESLRRSNDAKQTQDIHGGDAGFGSDVESQRDIFIEQFDAYEDEFSANESFADSDSRKRTWRRPLKLSTTALASMAAAAGAAAASAAHGHGATRETFSKKELQTKPSESPSSTTSPHTVATEESQSPVNNSVVTLEHRVKNGSSHNTLAQLKKPAVAMIAAYFLFITGSAAFLFTRWLSIPGLTNQIDRLEGQVDELEKLVDRLEIEVDRLSVEVDRLDSEVDRLSEENNRFAELNDELAANNAEYKSLNELLSNTTARYEELNMQLNASNVELGRLNGELQEQNEQYAQLNTKLNATAVALRASVDRLENVTTDLTTTNDELAEAVANLTTEVEELVDMNSFLNTSVFALDLEVKSLMHETERLAELNANLATITSFLNETANGINDSYNAISKFLSEQITAYRGVVVDTLKNVYVQRITNWDCDFRSFFLTQPFVRDPSVSIGDAAYPEVLDYVEERILSELCLDVVDFEVYLETEYVQGGQIPPVNVTTNDLKRSIQRYTRFALSHYFPETIERSGVGPNSADWAAAKYNCENLPTEKRFFLYS